MQRAYVAALLLAGALAGCSGGASGGQAQSITDSTTKAVYNNDYAGVTQNFDAALQQKITRAEVGTISDQMHRLGDYKGLTLLSTDPTKNEYYYRADFSNGSLRIGIRLDANDKLDAYRIFTQS